MSKTKRIEELEKKLERTTRELYGLWDRYNRLMRHLGITEVTYPKDKRIEKIPPIPNREGRHNG